MSVMRKYFKRKVFNIFKCDKTRQTCGRNAGADSEIEYLLNSIHIH